MQRTKSEIQQEIGRLRELINILHQRRHICNKQAALEGVAVEPKVLVDIDEATAQIRLYEEELAKLETHFVKEQFSLSEATYRRLLAEQLDNEDGRLRVVGRTRLEELRLQLGIAVERAQAIEKEVRADLAEEVFRSVNPGTICSLLGNDLCHEHWASLMQTIGRSIRLDSKVAARFFRSAIATSPEGGLGLHGFREARQSANAQWLELRDDQPYEQFLRDITGPIELHPRKTTTFVR